MASGNRSGCDGKRPNIVFIHAESMDGRKMGCMGNAALCNATPNLDRLAERGVLFTNAYTNCPVCNPSRAGMWTGKYPHHYDCWNNHEGLREGVPIVRDIFDNAGYGTALIGPLDYSYGKHSIRDRVGSWTRSARVRRPISRTPVPTLVSDGTANGEDWHRTYRAISHLHEATTGDRPFMLYLTTGLVHPAFVADRAHMARIDADKIEIPPGLGPLETTPHPVMEQMRIAKNCANPFSERTVREIRHVYLAMIAALDDMVGRVLQALEDTGLRDSTYVIFSSDHGEMAGEQNQILKRSMYEPSTHVPLIVAGPDVREGATVATPVTLVDLCPTLLDMGRIRFEDCAGTAGYPETLDGESLMPQLTENTARRRDWAFSGYHGDRCCAGTFMLRRGEWKYVKYMGYEPQLFNLSKDPWEQTNVASERSDIVRELDTLLTSNFDCEGIDARAKQYDKANFTEWRKEQKNAGAYEDTMANIHSGFDQLCIEDIRPWTADDERVIEGWLGE